MTHSLCSKLMLAAFLVLAPVLASRAKEPTLRKGSASSVGMSAEVVASGFQLFEEAAKADRLRGGVVLVARRGVVVLHEAFGWRNKEESLPMETSTLFKMASNTKPVVATAVLMLAEQGKLNLDDNVRRHIESWDNYRAGYIKIRHLLSHTSGMRIPGVFIRPLLSASADYPDAPSLRAEVDRFGRIGADEIPGSGYSYNNPAYQALGRLVEVTSESDLQTFLRERIYQPIGMEESWNYELDAPQERMACVYQLQDNKWNVVWKPGDGADWPFVRGSGGMISSTWDYAKFCQMQLNGGVYDGTRILREASVRDATRRHTSADDPGYGLGWVVDDQGGFGHSGSDGTYAWMDPERELIVLVFTQCRNGQNPRSQFQRLMADACEP